MPMPSSRNTYTRRQAPQSAPTAAASQAVALPEDLPEEYVDLAENVMRQVLSARQSVTTTKIRRIMTLVTEILNIERLNRNSTLKPESLKKLRLARVRMMYEAGRDDKVKDFIKKAGLLDYIKKAGNSRDGFMRFSEYMEALVAWHKYLGGRDN